MDDLKARVTNRPPEQVIAAIQALDVESVKVRLMDPVRGEGWTREHADAIEIAYKNFLTMLVKYPEDAEQIAMSEDTDEFWHTHILQTRKYADDCQAVFGDFLHHSPHLEDITPAYLEEKNASVEKTRLLYEKEFGADMDAAWSGGVKTADVAASAASIQVGRAAASAASIRAGNAAASAASIRTTNAAASAASIRVGKAAASAASIRAGNSAASAVSIRATNTAASAASIRVGKAAASAVSIRVDKAAASAASIQASNAAASAVSIRPANAAASGAVARARAKKTMAQARATKQTPLGAPLSMAA